MSDQCGAKICVEIKIARVHKSIRSSCNETATLNFLDKKTLDVVGDKPIFLLLLNGLQCQREVYT